MKAEKSLTDFAVEADSVEELASNILDGRSGTKAVRELLQEASEYKRSNDKNQVCLSGPEEVRENILPAYENLRPYSSDDVAMLLADEGNNLVDVRHIRASDFPDADKDAMVTHFMKQAVNRHASKFILVIPERLHDTHQEMYFAVEDFKRLSSGGFLGKDCLEVISINQRSEAYIDYVFTEHGSKEVRKGATWQPPKFFTVKEEDAIRDYHFGKLMGKRFVPNRSSKTFDIRSKETDASFCHLVDGMRWLSREETFLITMDDKNRVNGVYNNTTGDLNSSVINGGLLMEQFLEPQVSSAIFLHNHPSSGTEPSRADCRSNTDLQIVARRFQKPVYSILVAGDSCTDFTNGNPYDKDSYFTFQPKHETSRKKSRVAASR